MPVLRECPGFKKLTEMLAGELPQHDIDNISEHLENCLSCRHFCQRHSKQDTLLDAVRGLQDTGGAEPVFPATLKGRIKAMVAAPSRRRDVDDLGFLAPPELPDELGRLGGYRILRVLGKGGMGIVFQAEDERLMRPVALKVMLSSQASKVEAKARFLQEARATAAIEHDNIVTIYQVGEDSGVPFIAMSFLKGSSLEDYLQERTDIPQYGLSLAEIGRLGQEIAKGLQAAHVRGLIHRDIKPSNIWLDSSAGGRVKILDFGLVRSMDADKGLTSVGAILGTPAYMSPEQASGVKVDGRSDLFGLGVVLYRICTGISPFQRSDVISTLMALATHIPPPASQINRAVPAALSRLICQLIQKDPNHRMASASDVVQALTSLEPINAERTERADDNRASETNHLTTDIHRKTTAENVSPTARITALKRKKVIVIAAAIGGVFLVMALGLVRFLPFGNKASQPAITEPDIKVAAKPTVVADPNLSKKASEAKIASKDADINALATPHTPEVTAVIKRDVLGSFDVTLTNMPSGLYLVFGPQKLSIAAGSSTQTISLSSFTNAARQVVTLEVWQGGAKLTDVIGVGVQRGKHSYGSYPQEPRAQVRLTNLAATVIAPKLKGP